MASRDREGRSFLEWALPKLGLRWEGFDGVHGQVVKRVVRRMRALGLGDWASYRRYLTDHPAEWRVLDSLCHVTISRFYRERAVFELLRSTVFPALVMGARARGDAVVRALSLGAGGGEEPYSLRIAWDHMPAPSLPLSILAVEADAAQLERSRIGEYHVSSITEVPVAYVDQAFEREGDVARIRDALRLGIDIECGDIRDALPEGKFDLVCCRNLAFTYFKPELQKAVLARIDERLQPQGVLVIGRQERLPEGSRLVEVEVGSNVFRRPD